MSPFVQKLIWTVLAVGIYVLAALPDLASASKALDFLAGLVVGSVWVTRPGDGEMLKAGKEALRASIAPTAVGVVLALLLASCASAPSPADIRDTTKTVCAAGKAAETIAEVVHDRANREDAGAPDPAVGGLDAGAQDAAPVSP